MDDEAAEAGPERLVEDVEVEVEEEARGRLAGINDDEEEATAGSDEASSPTSPRRDEPAAAASCLGRLEVGGRRFGGSDFVFLMAALTRLGEL